MQTQVPLNVYDFVNMVHGYFYGGKSVNSKRKHLDQGIDGLNFA